MLAHFATEGPFPQPLGNGRFAKTPWHARKSVPTARAIHCLSSRSFPYNGRLALSRGVSLFRHGQSGRFRSDSGDVRKPLCGACRAVLADHAAHFLCTRFGSWCRSPHRGRPQWPLLARRSPRQHACASSVFSASGAVGAAAGSAVVSSISPRVGWQVRRWRNVMRVRSLLWQWSARSTSDRANAKKHWHQRDQHKPEK